MSNLPALTDEQMDLIKNTVAKGATDNELKLFLYRCKEIGLDPLKPGQIFFIKYGTGPGTIVIGRDGFRARAAAIGLHTGTKVGIIRDDKGSCLGAWCEVYRKDWKEPAREEVSLKEYDTGKGQWAKMPETMIKKVAEVAALRMAFPDQLSGLYSTDEMDQATPMKQEAVRLPIKTLADIEAEHSKELQVAIREDMSVASVGTLSTKPRAKEPKFTVPAQFTKLVTPDIPDVSFDDLTGPGEFVAQCGKPGGEIFGKKIKDIPEEQLMNYMKWLRTSATKAYLTGKSVQDFIKNAEDFINDTAQAAREASHD
jgi:phage recombination protein Bet